LRDAEPNGPFAEQRQQRPKPCDSKWGTFAGACLLPRSQIDGMADRDGKKGPPPLASTIPVEATSKSSDADAFPRRAARILNIGRKVERKIRKGPCPARPRNEMRIVSFLRGISQHGHEIRRD